MDVVRDYSDDVLDEIFTRVGVIDLSQYSREDLISIGIVDEHDLDLFTSLNGYFNPSTTISVILPIISPINLNHKIHYKKHNEIIFNFLDNYCLLIFFYS